MHLRFSCLVVLPLRSLTLAAQVASATIVAVQIYNKHTEDPGLDALREQEVRRQQAVASDLADVGASSKARLRSGGQCVYRAACAAQ